MRIADCGLRIANEPLPITSHFLTSYPLPLSPYLAEVRNQRSDIRSHERADETSAYLPHTLCLKVGVVEAHDRVGYLALPVSHENYLRIGTLQKKL